MPLRVEQLSFLSRRILKVGSVGNLERSFSLSKKNITKPELLTFCISPLPSTFFVFILSVGDDTVAFCLFLLKTNSKMTSMSFFP